MPDHLSKSSCHVTERSITSRPPDSTHRSSASRRAVLRSQFQEERTMTDEAGGTTSVRLRVTRAPSASTKRCAAYVGFVRASPRGGIGTSISAQYVFVETQYARETSAITTSATSAFLP